MKKPSTNTRPTKKTSTVKKPSAKKASTVKKASSAKKASSVKKPSAKKASTAKKATAKKASTAKKATAKKPPARRADLGAPIDTFFSKQPAGLRPILEALRAMVEQEVPKATSGLKWGMPVFELNGTMVCAIGGHKSHVKLILSGPPGTFADPKGLLAGGGKTGRHLKLTSLDELPRDAVRGWLRAAVALAAKKKK